MEQKMIKVEDGYYYKAYGVYKKDHEASGEARYITEEEAVSYMSILAMMGYRRHENSKQIFFDKQIDCDHCVETIFWK